MMQMVYKGVEFSTTQFMVNLDSYSTSGFTTDTKFLIGLKSQLTGKELFVIPATSASLLNERFISLIFFIHKTTNTPTSFIVVMGNSDYPYGFYDVSIYLNSSSSNLDPTGLTRLYSGLGNLTGGDDFETVKYKEYTTNDSDTESVYITL